jgi:hypothetical protein
MKTFCLSTLNVVFLLLSSNGLQAQTTQPKLNQVELFKQLIGTWRCEIAKDTIVITDIQPFGTGLEDSFEIVTKGKVLEKGKELYGYEKTIDKFITQQITSSGGLVVYAEWFSFEDVLTIIYYSDVSNPEKATKRWEEKFKSPDIQIQTLYVNNKPVKTDTWTRIKR